GAAGDARVVHEDRGITHVFVDMGNHGVDLAAFADVAHDGCGAAAHGANGAHGFLQDVGVTAGHGDVGAGLRQRERDGTTDPASATGDQGDPAAQLRHDQCSPRILVSFGRSMFPPETMHAMRPFPALPDSATARATAPAPSAMTRLRSAISRRAAAISSRLAVKDPSSSSCAMTSMFAKTVLLPMPSTKDGW